MFSVLLKKTSFGVVRDQVHLLVLLKNTRFGVVCDQVHIFGLSKERALEWFVIRCISSACRRNELCCGL